MQLITPKPEHKQNALAYRQDHLDYGELKMPGSNGFAKAESYENWLDSLGFIKTGRHGHLVPSTTYFAMVNNEIVGVVNIRHKLNDDLLKIGGHIGFSIRPSQRRKGYATQMLRLTIEKCMEMGIEKALVTCNKDNIGSKMTIEKNGGMLENEYIGEKGDVSLRFWINV